MSKECDIHHRDKYYRRCFLCLLFLVILVLLVVLIVYLVLRPTKPKFFLTSATVLQFNLSGSPPNLLTSQLQVTISSFNPNDRIGIYYDRLNVYASYRSQQITLPYPITPIYQGHKDQDAWSPYLSGVGIPIAPYLGLALQQDETDDGFFFLWIKIDGRIRWKVGDWTSGHYHLFVNCPAYLSFDRKSTAIKFHSNIATCSVDV